AAPLPERRRSRPVGVQTAGSARPPHRPRAAATEAARATVLEPVARRLPLPPVRRTAATLALASLGAALGRLAEAALLVAALEVLAAAPSRGLRTIVLAMLLAVGAATLLFEMAVAGAAQALGRRRETGLRWRLAAKLPRLP